MEQISDKQRARIFSLRNDLRLTDRELREFAEHIVGKASIGRLNADEARRVIDALNGAVAFVVLRFYLRDVNR